MFKDILWHQSYQQTSHNQATGTAGHKNRPRTDGIHQMAREQVLQPKDWPLCVLVATNLMNIIDIMQYLSQKLRGKFLLEHLTILVHNVYMAKQFPRVKSYVVLISNNIHLQWLGSCFNHREYAPTKIGVTPKAIKAHHFLKQSHLSQVFIQAYQFLRTLQKLN